LPRRAQRHSDVSCAKTAEPIEMLFGLWSQVEACMRWSAHWRHGHLANTTEPIVCGGDAALCEITLITCYY